VRIHIFSQVRAENIAYTLGCSPVCLFIYFIYLFYLLLVHATAISATAFVAKTDGVGIFVAEKWVDSVVRVREFWY